MDAPFEVLVAVACLLRNSVKHLAKFRMEPRQYVFRMEPDNGGGNEDSLRENNSGHVIVGDGLFHSRSGICAGRCAAWCTSRRTAWRSSGWRSSGWRASRWRASTAWIPVSAGSKRVGAGSGDHSNRRAQRRPGLSGPGDRSQPGGSERQYGADRLLRERRRLARRLRSA